MLMRHPYVRNNAVTFLFLLAGAISTMAQTNWTKDPTNPVLRRDTVFANLPNDIIVISDCWVMKLGTQYKMWYTCATFNTYRYDIGYAYSPDGLSSRNVLVASRKKPD